MSFGIFEDFNPRAKAKMDAELADTINYLEENVTTPEGNPIAYVKPGHEPSIFKPRTVVDMDVMKAEINISKGLGKLIRKIMQNEIRSRKPSLYKKYYEEGMVTRTDKMADEMLRGTWWRGQKTLPEPEYIKDGKLVVRHSRPTKHTLGEEHVETDIWSGKPDLRHSRHKIGNLGEPIGVSMSSRPTIAEKFSEGKSDEVARVMPLYNKDPMDTMLRQWEPEHRKVIADSYIDAAKKIFKEKGDDYIPFSGETKDYLESFQGEFNTHLTKNLQSKGYKGILYHPDRYGEAELKMFNPRDVLVVDRRKAAPLSSDEWKSYEAILNKPGKAVTGRYGMRKLDQVDKFEKEVYDIADFESKIANKPPQGTSLRDIYRQEKVTQQLENQLPYGKMSVGNVRTLLMDIRGYNHAKINPESTPIRDMVAKKSRIEGWKDYLDKQYGSLSISYPMPEGVKKIYNLIGESNRHIEALKRLSFTKEKGTNTKIIRHKEALKKLFDEAGNLNDEIGKKVRF